MSKELELFKNIEKALAEKYVLSVGAYENLIRIEKSLKALEIIKEKKIDVFQLLIAMKVNDLNEYNKRHAEYLHLTQEEYDLLKEVLL